ncbi:putative glycosyltransferase [Quercus suber]|uniref:Glycosyltransferase n=1 Tax=Quercus suber TaxID=58331 RepID=A0AAW0LXH2_QUESU
MSKADRIRKNRILSKPLSQNPSPNTEPRQYVQYFSKTINKIPWKQYFKVILVCLFFLIFALEHSSNGSDSFYSLFHSRFVGYLSEQQEESGLHFHEIMESNYKPVKQKGNPYYSENFTTNYYQMEMKFKVYMYPEDEVLNKYYQNGSEGYFFKNIKDSQFRTTIAQEAHLFFIPIRTHQMHNMGTSNEEMAIVVQNYVQSLITENPYWNKSQGADHFFINCHEIGVMATKGLPLMKNAIQVQEESGLHFHEIMESNYKPVKQKGNPYYSENFTTNYYQMEMKFKVYMYPEDEVLNKYYQNGSEGYFFKNIKDSQFRTTIAQEAHLFFIPIRTHQMHNMGTSNEEMAIVVQNYVQSLITENPYWNKSQGADHFFINCHEIGVMATKGLPLMKNAIQVVCASPDALEFNPFKDIIIPAQDLKPSTTRKVVRDSELDRKYCSCRLSPFRAACMVESILEECVPAIVTFLNLDLPFNDTLDWTRFSIIGRTKGVHLNGEKLSKLHNNLLEIRKHFQWNSPPVRLDAFHMVIYELWQHARRLHFT